MSDIVERLRAQTLSDELRAEAHNIGLPVAMLDGMCALYQDAADTIETLRAENERLRAIVLNVYALSVSAEPRYEDRDGACWAKPYADSQPTRKVYLIDAGKFDKVCAAIEAAAAAGEDGGGA